MPGEQATGGTLPAPERLFYDGSCALCHWAVRFVLARDREGRAFRFAPLDSDAYRLQAVLAAIKIQERVGAGDYPWTMRIGIASGLAITGMIGSRRQTSQVGGNTCLSATPLVVRSSPASAP